MENKMKTKMQTNDQLIKKFLLINFGLTFLFGLILHFAKTRGGSGADFAALQMYFPALAVILTLMTSGVDLSKTTKRTYIIYILATCVFALESIISIFIPNLNLTNGLIIGTSALVFIGLLTEKKDKRLVANLKRAKLKVGLPVIFLFLLLYFLRPGISAALAGDFSSFSQAFSPEKLAYALGLVISFPLSFLPFFGEEYGWRYFLQPLMQKKYGMRKGIILLGIIWGLWHLPLNIFYYSAAGSQVQSLVNQVFLCIAYAIFFGYAYTKTGSIWTATFIHYLNNNLILMFTDVMDPSVIENQVISWPEVAMGSLLSLLLFGGFIFSKYLSDRKFLTANSIERFYSSDEIILEEANEK